MKSVSRLFLVAALLLSKSVYPEDLKEINLGVIFSESQEVVAEDWRPLVEMMEARLGIPVRIYFASDYAGVVQAMRFGKVQVANMGAKAAAEAIDRANGEVFATPMPDQGEPGYYSLIITRKDRPIKNLEEVIRNGGSYTYGSGDPNSTSGFLVPGYYVFAKNKIDPKTHFKRTVFANHMTNLLAVLNGHVDIAANNSFNMEQARRKDPARVAPIRILWKSPLIPDAPLVWNKNLSDYDKTRILKYFTELGQPGPNQEKEVAAMARNGWSGIKPANNDYLLPVRELMLFKKKLLVEQATDTSLDEKRERIDEINKSLARLRQNGD